MVWFGLVCLVWFCLVLFGRLENLSGGCHCCDCCDGGKTKSTPSLGFRLRLEFDNIFKLNKVKNKTLNNKFFNFLIFHFNYF